MTNAFINGGDLVPNAAAESTSRLTDTADRQAREILYSELISVIVDTPPGRNRRRTARRITRISPLQPDHPAVSSIEDLTANACRRVRQLRAQRDWSLDELSSRCRVSRSMLSEIERGRANPTLAVALRIAQAFEITLDELVDSDSPRSRIEVIRGNDPHYQFRRDEECEVRTLSPLQREKDVEIYEVKLARGGALRSSAHFEGTREFLTVIKGNVQVESDASTETLRAGDSANYFADQPHAIVNRGKGEATIYLVVVYQ
ncbi:helix-turn-helix domain-containing protein [Roseiconus nitratireducens]|uniref:helix-turn-helix domain-containing protein n=1 Tax=Roseiconus nitratireducens TaxID=2605748 RepID=UPI001F221045|nr:XRE family transcriptional regulator [Roseiconus nitratireducens]